MGHAKFDKSYMLLLNFVMLSVVLNPPTLASEFPDRECCDPVYPIPPPGPSSEAERPPPYPEYVPSTPSHVDVTGVQPKGSEAVHNCLKARELCIDNSACGPILATVPRVCGGEKVSCSTVTVKKCQAALRTLQAFPYFSPVCLCPTPTSDPSCNSFRDFVFEHPCYFVKEKEKDPYPVDALPTCDYALDICRKQPHCHQLYKDFRRHCHVNENGTCNWTDWIRCQDALTKLRLTPMFGCICPNTHPPNSHSNPNATHNMTKCDKIFLEVNYNHCVASGPTVDFSGITSAGSLHSLDDRVDDETLLAHFLSFSPISLFPKFRHVIYAAPPAPPQHAYDDDESNAIPAARTESHLYVDQSYTSTPVSYRGGSVEGIQTADVNPHEHKSQVMIPILGPGTLADWHTHSPPPFHPTHYFPSSPGPGVQSHSGDSPRKANDNSVVPILRKTCATVLQECQRSADCMQLLQPVLHWCEPVRCSQAQDTCMLALQTFFAGADPKWSSDVAFCGCNATTNKNDECVQAREKLHPVCAQRGDPGMQLPSCNSLAESCRQESECKLRLEYYEQACAVDSVTNKCAGPSSECRFAILRTLGTKLRTLCACNGTDANHLYDCMGWQRILWFNPCVKATQREYIRTQAVTLPTTTTARTTSTQSHPPSEYTTSTSEAVTGLDQYSSTGLSSNPIMSSTIRTSATSGPRGRYEDTTRWSQGSSSRSTSTTDDFTTFTTTYRPTTTTAPPRYCTVRRANQPHENIIEGTSKRLYPESDPQCSELCICVRGEPVSCSALDCVKTGRCEYNNQRSPMPVIYSHTHPMFIAHQGYCVCYSGEIICAKPPEDTYSLHPGVFLFLGYSREDEKILKPHTMLQSNDIVATLQNLISSRYQQHPHQESGINKIVNANGTGCRLDLYKAMDQNLIINATLAEEDGVTRMSQVSESLLIKEKEVCRPVLDVISDLVNNNDALIQSHALLSIVKKAEVIVVGVPTQPGSPSEAAPSPRISAFVAIVFFLPPHLLLSVISILITARTPWL